MTTPCVRTAPERFTQLTDIAQAFAYEPRYIDDLPSFQGLRLCFIDVQPSGVSNNQKVALCLHGQPTWSYLYRKMIPPLLAAGFRVIAPDLFGFGRSDKPVEDQWYQFDTHRQSLIELIERLDLQRVTLVVQDWGGLLGLTLPHEMPNHFEQLLVMNTTLGTGDVELSQGFLDWRAYIAAQTKWIDCGKIIGRGTPHLTAAEIAAYNAPFESIQFQAGVRRFPQLVPEFIDSPGAELSRRARQFWQTQWQGKSFMVVGMQDPVLGPQVMQQLASHLKGCPKPYCVQTAGHFVQEWQSGQIPIVQTALQHYGATT